MLGKQVKIKFIQSLKGAGKIPCLEPLNNNLNVEQVIANNLCEIENYILIYGGVLFRGFIIDSVEDFSIAASSFLPNFIEYNLKYTPRTKVADKVYTSTEYRNDRFIPFHSECSYATSWPNTILFFCLTPPGIGGETPLADNRLVYKKLSKPLVNKLNSKKILYIRNYSPLTNFDWRYTFNTTDKNSVELACLRAGISFKWKSEQIIELTTKQVGHASITHPITREPIWFNQAHVRHISALINEDKEQLLKIVAGNLKNIPQNAFCGDGKNIKINYLSEIRSAYEDEKIEFKWEKSDLLILDNLLMAHSRNPYKGERKILVAMGNR
ncbi:MAG: TauD/TfdA family dioxygenase [Alphaproteobacteria bacterium]|nr:TauD/TfdA family dioxygenase [Alphaproteobacteria bacterium]